MPRRHLDADPRTAPHTATAWRTSSRNSAGFSVVSPEHDRRSAQCNGLLSAMVFSVQWSTRSSWPAPCLTSNRTFPTRSCRALAPTHAIDARGESTGGKAMGSTVSAESGHSDRRLSQELTAFDRDLSPGASAMTRASPRTRLGACFDGPALIISSAHDQRGSDRQRRHVVGTFAADMEQLLRLGGVLDGLGTRAAALRG
ncbi:hypothetical protein ABH922_003095 [Rhodococcus sp. 27YEA15]